MTESAHPLLTHRNGDQCVFLHGEWFVPYDAGGDGVTCSNPEHDESTRIVSRVPQVPWRVYKAPDL